LAAPIGPPPMSSWSSNFPPRLNCSGWGMSSVPQSLPMCALHPPRATASGKSAQGPIIDASQQGPRGIVHRHVATREHSTGDLQEPFFGHPRDAPPAFPPPPAHPPPHAPPPPPTSEPDAPSIQRNTRKAPT